MLGDDAKALQPLLRVVASNGLPASDQMSAILVAMPMLQKKSEWLQVIKAGGCCSEADNGQVRRPMSLQGVNGPVPKRLAARRALGKPWCTVIQGTDTS